MNDLTTTDPFTTDPFASDLSGVTAPRDIALPDLTASDMSAFFPDQKFRGQAPSLMASAEDALLIKMAARAVLPRMGPQRRLEAVARSLRFGSYAAMSAALARSSREDPVLLQMALGQLPDILLEGLEAWLAESERARIAAIDTPGQTPYDSLEALGYVSTGAAFLSALHAARKGTLKDLGFKASFCVGVDDRISALHRTAALQGLPPSVVKSLRAESCVITLRSGVEVAPVARVVAALSAERGGAFLGAESVIGSLYAGLDYEMTYPDFAGEGVEFGSIPLDTAVFVSDNVSRIDVLPLGWTCSWPNSHGASCSDWSGWSFDERLDMTRAALEGPVAWYGVPRAEIGRAFRIVPELCSEPEALAVRRTATPRVA